MEVQFQRVNRWIGNVMAFAFVMVFIGVAIWLAVSEFTTNGFSDQCKTGIGLTVFGLVVMFLMFYLKTTRNRYMKKGIYVTGKITEIYRDNDSKGQYKVRCLYENSSTGKRYEGYNSQSPYWCATKLNIGDPVDVYVNDKNWNRCYVDVIGTVEKRLGR